MEEKIHRIIATVNFTGIRQGGGQPTGQKARTRARYRFVDGPQQRPLATTALRLGQFQRRARCRIDGHCRSR